MNAKLPFFHEYSNEKLKKDFPLLKKHHIFCLQ